MAKGKVIAASLAALMAIGAPFVTMHEGLRTKPYLDPVGIRTVCVGETSVPMRNYTKAECEEMLSKRLKEFALKVQKLSPGIEENQYEWLAHTSFAYNVGVSAYSKSSVRRLFNQKKYVAACRFMRQYKYAGGRVLTGLIYRREGHDERIGEYELCLVGAVPRELG